EERTGLAVGDPVGGHGRAGRQHLLEHDVTLERAPLVPAVALRPRHRDPAADTHLFAELAVEAAPGVRAPHRRGVAELPAQELAHLGAQRLGLGRQLAQLEPERLHAHAYDSRLRSSTKRPCALSGSVGCKSSMWPMPVGKIAFLNPNSLDSPR